MQWKVDKLALQKACKTLGIEKPVFVYPRKLSHLMGRANTIHIGETIVLHSITINSGITILEASKTIWHELTHCQQAERDGARKHLDEYNKQMEAYEKQYGKLLFETKAYRRIPAEAEAYANERKYRYRILVIER